VDAPHKAGHDGALMRRMLRPLWVTLALLFGLYSMIYGFSQITAGIQARQLGKSVQSLSPLHKAA